VLSVVTALVLVYGLIAAAAAWVERPTVSWDEQTGHWRSARVIQRERTGQWPRP